MPQISISACRVTRACPISGLCSYPTWRSQPLSVGRHMLTACPGPRIDSVHFTIIVSYAALIRYITFTPLSKKGRPHNLLPSVLLFFEVRWSGFEYLSLIKRNPVEPRHPVPYDPSRRALVVIAALFTSLHKPPHWAQVHELSMSSSSAPSSAGKHSATMVGTTNAANSAKTAATKMHRRSRTGKPYFPALLQGSCAWTFG